MKWLYVASLTSVVVHEIDSAFWHEWTLLGLPGGIQAFLVAHLVLVPVFLVGLVRAAQNVRVALPYAIVLSVAGLAGVALHASQLLSGGQEFRNPTSVAILVFMLGTCLPLLLTGVRIGMRGRTDRPSGGRADAA